MNCYIIPLDPDLSPGEYQLEIGMYQLETGQRLPIVNDEGQVVDGRVPLKEITVKKVLLIVGFVV
jgi:hypothetical protein